MSSAMHYVCNIHPVTFFINSKNKPRFKGRYVAKTLDYLDTKQEIRITFDEVDKKVLGEIIKSVYMTPLKGNE